MKFGARFGLVGLCAVVMAMSASVAASAAPGKPGITGEAVVELGQIASFDAMFKVRDDTLCHDPVFTWGDGTTGDLDPSVTAVPGVFSDSIPVQCGPQMATMSGEPVYTYVLGDFTASHIYCTPGTYTVSVRAPKAMKVKGKRVHSMQVQVVAPADGGTGRCQTG